MLVLIPTPPSRLLKSVLPSPRAQGEMTSPSPPCGQTRPRHPVTMETHVLFYLLHSPPPFSGSHIDPGQPCKQWPCPTGGQRTVLAGIWLPEAFWSRATPPAKQFTSQGLQVRQVDSPAHFFHVYAFIWRDRDTRERENPKQAL